MDEGEALPAGPLVRLRVEGEGLLVLIEPPLPSGDQHPQHFARRDRDFAWLYARTLWVDHRLGFSDETDGNFGRCGPYRQTTDL